MDEEEDGGMGLPDIGGLFSSCMAMAACNGGCPGSPSDMCIDMSDCADNLIGCMDFCEMSAACLSKTFGIFASPCAFPCIYCFDSEDPDNVGRDWAISMEMAPTVAPFICCCTMCMPCCMQWYVRRKVLNHDMTRYKCCQGIMDGPYCLAACNPSLPFTFTAGTYGESNCPVAYLCCVAFCCVFLAFEASRLTLRQELGLRMDPSEVRMHKCVEFWHNIAACCFCGGCCLQLCGCCCTCWGNGEVGASADQLGEKCVHIAHQIMEGIYWVLRIAMSCMSSQIIHECNLAKDVLGTGGGTQMSAPGQMQMPPQMYGQKQ